MSTTVLEALLFDWSAWMRQVGRQTRLSREFLGLSQDQLARMAGVSQGAVSRLEAGRGLSTPLLVAAKIHVAVVKAVAALDPTILNPDLRQHLENLRQDPTFAAFFAETPPADPELEEIVRLYRRIPDSDRGTFLAVVSAASASLAPPPARPTPVRAAQRA
jgi:transcriptional regulator with XRE-family HTH domain